MIHPLRLREFRVGAWIGKTLCGHALLRGSGTSGIQGTLA